MSAGHIIISAPSLPELKRIVDCFSGFANDLDSKGVGHSFDTQELADIELKMDVLAQDMKKNIGDAEGQFNGAASLVQSNETGYGTVKLPETGNWQVLFSGSLEKEEWRDMCRLTGMVPDIPRDDGSVVIFSAEDHAYERTSARRQAQRSMRKRVDTTNYFGEKEWFGRADETSTQVNPLAKNFVEQMGSKPGMEPA